MRIIARKIAVLLILAASIAAPVYAQNLELVASLPTDFAHSVFIVGRYAYVADYISGLRVVDISDPYSPEQIGEASVPLLRALHVSNHLLAGCAVDLYILDVNDPQNPFILGFTMIPGWAQYCYMKDSLVYIGSGSHGLSYVNISDPSNPVLLGNYFTSGAGEELLIRDEVVYLADYDRGLQIIDISEPYIPDSIGACDTPELAIGIWISGAFAYLANMGAGMQVIDISNPAYPTIAGHYNTPNEAQDVCVQDNYAYIADRYSGLQIADISNPGAPFYASSYNTPGIAYGVAVQGKFIYVADGSSLLIFTFRPTGVDDAEELPSGFSLAQNYPNPFNPSTTIEYQLPEAAQVNIDIFDINGRKVTALADEYKAPGEYSVSWNAPENESGVYFYRIQADKYTNTKSCILLK